MKRIIRIITLFFILLVPDIGLSHILGYLIGEDFDPNVTDPYGPILYDVSFKMYENSENYGLGLLSLKIKIPDGITPRENSKIILGKTTSGHIKITIPLEELKGADLLLRRFWMCDIPQNSEKEISITTKTPWGTYFLATFEDSDRNLHYSKLEHTDKYLSPEEFDSIYGNLAAETIDSDKCEYLLLNDKLIVNSKESFNLSLFDLVGRCVFSKSFSGNSSIDLSEFNCNILIMHIRSDNNNIITKISIKP